MRSKAILLAFMAMMMANGQAFHVTTTSSTHHTKLFSTQLSARQSQNRRKSNTAAYYASTADPPLTDKPPASFANRMRNMVLRQQEAELQQFSSTQSAPKKSKHNPAKPAFVEEAVSLKEYKKIVADEHEKLVVVRFYAKWCRACKAAEPLFYRMAHSMPDIKFVEVPVLEENANLHQGLGVPALPFAHIYSPTVGLVEELRMAKKEFKTFQSVVETYREGECSDLELDPETGVFSSPFQKDKEENSEQE